MNASVLARPYQKPEDQTYDTPDPREAPMNHPTAFMVGMQETGAQFYPNEPRTVVSPTELPDEGRPMGRLPMLQPQPLLKPQAAPSPAQTIARGTQRPTAGTRRIPKGWTKERMDEEDELNRLGRSFADRVDSRRAKKKDLTKYERVKGQLDAQAEALHDLRELKKSYGKDDPHALAIQQKIMTRLIAAERLHGELGKHAQGVSKKHGIPLGKDGFLEDYDGHLEEDDKAFDDEAMSAMAELSERRPAD